MIKIFRIIDANINRASEGLRILEDIVRFVYDNKALSQKIKTIRHGVRKNILNHYSKCIGMRDSENDVGLMISKELEIDNKKSLYELITANFKRVQEALRTVEETLKVAGEYDTSKIYEEYRFDSYSLEKDFYKMDCRLDKRKKMESCLYCITSEEHSCGRNNIEVVKAMIDAGVKIIQYREKEKKLSQKYEECLIIKEMTKNNGVTFIINDDVDIAMLVNADGVHLGQDDLPILKVRNLIGEEMIIGVSTHSPEQALAAVKNGADYIGVGPIYKTYTKKDVCEPVGLDYLEYAAKNIEIPFVAIGGIKEHNLPEVKFKGAKCVALVTEIVGADNIEKKIGKIFEIMRGEK